MELISRDRVLRVMSITRFHFVCGLPCSGVDRLMRLLAQNPRFLAPPHSPAADAYRAFEETVARPDIPLDPDQRKALMRGVLDAVHHRRRLDAVVFDAHPDWIFRTEELSALFPLARFIVMVRGPEAIAETLRKEGLDEPDTELMAMDGAIGAPMRALRAAMSGPRAERILVIDHDKLVQDPDGVLSTLYAFVREPEMPHVPEPMQGDLVPVTSKEAFWARMRRSEATLLLH